MLVVEGHAYWRRWIQLNTPPYTFTLIINKPNQIRVSEIHLPDRHAQVDRICGVLGVKGLEPDTLPLMGHFILGNFCEEVPLTSLIV